MSKDGLDLQSALERTGNDRPLLREMAALFLGECPALMRELQVAIESGDSEAVERTAHALKGSILNFGAEGAVAAALGLEQSARAGQNIDFPAGFLQLQQALKPLFLDLRALLEYT